MRKVKKKAFFCCYEMILYQKIHVKRSYTLCSYRNVSFQSYLLSDFSKWQQLCVIICNISQNAGISVDRRHGLYISQSIVNFYYHSDNAMGKTALQFNAALIHDAERPCTSFAPPQNVESGLKVSESASFWGRASNVKQERTESKK